MSLVSLFSLNWESPSLRAESSQIFIHLCKRSFRCAGLILHRLNFMQRGRVAIFASHVHLVNETAYGLQNLLWCTEAIDESGSTRFLVNYPNSRC